MNRWLHKFMAKPGISDRFELLDKKMENMHGLGPDKTDKFDPTLNMSDLSGHPLGLLDEKLENNPRKGGDKSARFKFEPNISVLSVRTQRVLDQNLENIPKTKPDKSDKTNAGDLLSDLSGSTHDLFGKIPFTFSNGSDLSDEYEERLAIAEYGAQYNALHQKQGPSYGGTDYLDAWKGFKYNLEKPQNCPIWVAYASSKPVEGPLYKNTSVTSPDIKRAITVLMGENFYGLLGIFNDPIALADDKEKGNSIPKQQSMPFFSAIARFVKDINPSTKFGAVRPIKAMREVIKKSGVKFSESCGGPQKIEYPYIRYVKDVVYTWDQDKLTEEEKANFGDASYIIVDPRTNEFYQISQNHWFSKNPFLGGMDFGTIAKYPLVLMDIEGLIKYSQ